MMQGMYYIVYCYFYVKTTLIYIITLSYVLANQNALAGGAPPRGAQGTQGGMVQETGDYMVQETHIAILHRDILVHSLMF